MNGELLQMGYVRIRDYDIWYEFDFEGKPVCRFINEDGTHSGEDVRLLNSFHSRTMDENELKRPKPEGSAIRMVKII